MKILIDMNLSPAWCEEFAAHGYETRHWSTIGNCRAPDEELLAWASAHEYVVFTHDLDFSAILAATQATGPSVIQVRTQNVLPSHLAPILFPALQQFSRELHAGAIVLIDEARHRVRLLPLR